MATESPDVKLRLITKSDEDKQQSPQPSLQPPSPQPPQSPQSPPQKSQNISRWLVILGICAGTFTTLAFLPQGIVAFKDNIAPRITLLTLISAILGNCLWFIYALDVKDYILTVFSVIAVAIFTMLLFQKYLLPKGTCK